ncbi:hypothetical protein A9K58_12050 [Stenotrophomonas maltophilia]|uniref:Methyltransferase type 11 domain-containing protein n=1 Tax=Stenotrophomonas maltophilia TaxID=40324 RepID=A0A1A6XUU2_STEMA|nr:hypothetical protein [Stenotrophomonas maltophilia]OBU66485.1 hypothetical protein A9K58_12050 [Stenotrophomonas maltophilia]
MPALQSTRQASQAPWFDSEPAAALRVLERQLLLPQLSLLPAQPWLWIAPSVAWLEDARLGGRGLRLYRHGQGYAGDTRCGLPLPLANESVNAIVLQHVTAADAALLLDECERVLMQGGHLWLSSLNPFSPYRTRWRRHGLVVRTPQRIRLLLGRHGLECDDVRYLGPLWDGDGSRRHGGWAPLRAACLFHAEKRTLALPGPTPLPVRWHGTVAT